MAARNTTLTGPAGQWLEITDNDVSAISIQNQGQGDLLVKAAVDATPPVSTDGCLIYDQRAGDTIVLAERFLGIDAPVRVFVRCGAWPVSIFVSHAGPA